MRGFQKVLFLNFFLLGLMWSSSVLAQDSYVLVRIYEPVNQNGEIIISYGNGKSERIPIEKLNSIHHENNANKIVAVFNRLAKEGYEMTTSAGSGHGNPASILHVDTFVFVKEE